MIKSHEELRQRPMEIDLTGPDGNAFILLGKATKLAKMLGMDSKVITDDMKSGDYEHLIEVFEREFGQFVVLYR